MRDNLPDIETVHLEHLEESKDIQIKETSSMFDWNEVRGEGDKRLLRRIAREKFGLKWAS